MKAQLALLMILALVGCKKANPDSSGAGEIPIEFQGEWIFDEDSATAEIDTMEISDEEKLKLQSSYIGIVRGERRSVNSTGLVSGPSFPDGVVEIRIQVERVTEDGVIMKGTNSLNKDSIEYSLDSVVEGVWRSQMLDSSMNPVKDLPDNFWMRP